MAATDDLLGYIISYKMSHNGNSPSIREMVDAMGVSSVSVIEYHLKKLVRDGRITRTRGAARSIEVRGGLWRLE